MTMFVLTYRWLNCKATLLSRSCLAALVEYLELLCSDGRGLRKGSRELGCSSI